MIALMKKEFRLCLHPMCLVFLLFAAFVFIPNYPYEVMFFFSGLSVFFVCLTARENGDLTFSCTLPVRKRDVAVSRILFCMIFQAAMLVLAGVATAVKECCLPVEMQFNMAGSSANLAFLGYGAMIMGVFNLIFFPLYFRDPAKVGVPFAIASTVEFLLIAILIVFRFAVPLFSDILNLPDPLFMGAKAAAFCIGIVFYLGASVLAGYLSARNLERANL